MPTVAIQNNKGGVGKTTLVAALAAALGRRGQRVLAVDMDPQANLTRRLGHPENRAAPFPTLAAAIRADLPGCVTEIVLPCGWDDPCAQHIDVLPSSFDLDNRTAEAGIAGASLRLGNVLGNVPDRYDWTLIDCPPSLGHLTQMSMVATAHRGGYVLVVIEPEFDAMRGAELVQEFVEDEAPRKLHAPGLRVGGVVVNRLRSTELHTSNLADIQKRFTDLVWTPHLPLWTSLADAMNSAVPVHTLGGRRANEMAERFDALAARMEATS